MTKKSKLKNWTLKTFLILVACLGLTACDQISEEFNLNETKTKGVYKKSSSKKSQTLWDRIRQNFNISPRYKHAQEQHRVQQFVKQYRTNEIQLNKMSKASPYLHYIVEELEKRNMPTELALLPMIESSFEPLATSRRGAAGLWQFMGGTGRQFGLKQDKWYDGRRDITASTTAALDYLQLLHEQFDQNWMLALAAYNAGPGTVTKAIQRNLRAGKPANFWNLTLPKETQLYVPKFLALAEVVANPKKHDVSLPFIENKPYFITVNPKTHLTFNKVAKLADINVNEVKRLNPGYRKQSTHPKGPKQILLPASNAQKLKDNLMNIP